MLEKLNNIYNKCFDFVKTFISKEKYTKIKLALAGFICVLFAVVCEYTIMRKFHPEFISKNRMMLLAVIFYYIALHFIFKLNEMYEWIHKNRYKLACTFLLFVTVFKYSGSSIVNFNGFIQSHNDDSRYHTLLGKPRMIRTDEWATSTTYILSQANSSNPFSYFSNVLRGTTTDMFAVSNSPVKDIVMLGRPFQAMFLLLGNDYGLSFYWNIRMVAMLLGSYELCLILTDRKKKVSLFGAIVIAFSSAVQWWYCMDTLIWGQIVICLMDKFMNAKYKKTKYLCCLGILISGLSYVFVFYPAWQLPFGYVFLALTIFLLFKNMKYGNYRLSLHDVLIVLATIILILGVLFRWYSLSKDTLMAEMNTDYPGNRVSVGGGCINLYSYFYDIFFPYEDFLNPCEYSSMLSFYPIPLLLACIYVFRNKKDMHLYVPLIIVGLFLTVFCVWGLPKWLSLLTRMSMSTAGRCSIPLGTLCIYLLISLIGRCSKEDKLINKKYTIALAAVFVAYIAYRAKKTIGYEPDFKYLDRFKILVGVELFGLVIYGILNMQDEKIKNYTLYGLAFIALLSGVYVNPIIRTTDIFYTKPVAVKINEIKSIDPDAIWAVNDGGWYINDYALAQGVRVINSTNVYPNIELFETLLGKEQALEQRSDYNRYCHVNFEITNDESKLELLYADNVAIKVNYNDLSKLNIKYVLSSVDLDKTNLDVSFEKLYDEDGLYIYDVTKILEKEKSVIADDIQNMEGNVE